jgi:hypothetical protein
MVAVPTGPPKRGRDVHQWHAILAEAPLPAGEYAARRA